MNEYKRTIVIGAGLAGSEAAWQIAEQGIPVTLYEMRPVKNTPAHRTNYFAELVCSNSLRGAGLENAVGLIKEEMRRLNSLVMEAAYNTKIPAGGALAVDREGFSKYITDKIKSHSLIEVVNEEALEIPSEADCITVVASGPLTEGNLAKSISSIVTGDSLYFYDAVAPIVGLDTIDMSKAYWASRYGKGEKAYINCPFTEEEYDNFYNELIMAETTSVNEWDKEIFFEGCMPVEVMAARGRDTLLFGPLKPVGLEHPQTGVRPYAVVQLRQDNKEGTLYNIVGFQTHLKWGEQKRVFSLIPGLAGAEILRYGVMHRNTFINSPLNLKSTFQLKNRENIFFAGQITGVEGYVESTATGLMAGINVVRLIKGEKALEFPKETAMGALANYIATAEADSFQPMNINFGLLPPLTEEKRRMNKKDKRIKVAERALKKLEEFWNESMAKGK